MFIRVFRFVIGLAVWGLTDKMTNISQNDPQFLLFKEVPWMIVYICEAVLILAGNSITVCIFWNIRKQLKRTSYLLMNLAAADVIVGIGFTLLIGCNIVMMLEVEVSSIPILTVIIIDIGATVSSLLSLTSISLERMFAILYPYRHRLLKNRDYYVCISFIWLLSGANVISNLWVFEINPNNEVALSIFTSATYVICLVTISGAYLAIWISRRRNRMSNDDRRSMEKSRKLAKTLFIVTALSIITCLPYGITIAFADFSGDLFLFRVQIVMVILYLNSFLNPVVYCFRMPEFKASLKKLFCRCSLKRLSFDDNPQPVQ